MKTATIALLLVLLALVAASRGGAQPLNDEGVQPNEVKEGVARQNAKLDLTLCAPELESLQQSGSPEAIENAAQNPQCRQAIIRAREAGLSGSQIISILMGASGDPDPNPGPPPAGGSPAGNGN